MTIHISEVAHRCWPNENRIREGLKPFDLSPERIASSLSLCTHTRETYHEGGLQQYLAATIARHIATTLGTMPGISLADTRYSPDLNEKSDLALACNDSTGRVFFEVEFRPNVEKDLVKFQVAANRGALAAAVLILAIDRANINPDYTTMPEYRKFARIIHELQPPYPLLLIGIRIGDTPNNRRVARRRANPISPADPALAAA